MHSWADGAEVDEIGDFEEIAAAGGKKALGATPMGARVTAQLLHDDKFYGTTGVQRQNARRNRLRDRMGLGALWGDDDDE